MPKSIGNIAHIRTPKMRVSAELQGRMFGKVGRKGSVGSVVREISELEKSGNDYTKGYKRPVASWAEEFVSGAELPIESAVQMMSPEYYNWMRQTGTPIYDVELLRNAGDGRYVPADRLGNGKQGKYLRDMDYADSGLHMESGRGRSPEYDIRYVEREFPTRAAGRLLPTDIVGMQNNVQYGGTQYPYATRFYPGGGEGSLLVTGYTGGTNFGTWNPNRARGYAQSSSFGVGGRGRRLAYTVGGRPLIGVDKIEHTSDRIWGPIARYAGRNGEVIEISPELADDEVIGFIRGDGYGYFGDLSDQNQFAFGPGSSVKSLVGGSGNFDYRSPNIYERRGGTVESTKDMAHLARLFGISEKQEKIF